MPILSHNPAHERDHAPAAPVAFVLPDQATPSPDVSGDVLRIVDSRGAADFATFAECMSGRRVVVLVDEVAEFYDLAADRRAAALTQRAEIHVGLSDDLLGALAARAVYPRRPLWRRALVAVAAIVGMGVRA